jgi:hypothetical protein
MMSPFRVEAWCGNKLTGVIWSLFGQFALGNRLKVIYPLSPKSCTPDGRWVKMHPFGGELKISRHASALEQVIDIVPVPIVSIVATQEPMSLCIPQRLH